MCVCGGLKLKSPFQFCVPTLIPIFPKTSKNKIIIVHIPPEDHFHIYRLNPIDFPYIYSDSQILYSDNLNDLKSDYVSLHVFFVFYICTGRGIDLSLIVHVKLYRSNLTMHNYSCIPIYLKDVRA